MLTRDDALKSLTDEDKTAWPRLRWSEAHHKIEVDGRRGANGKLGKRERFDTLTAARARAAELRAEVKRQGVESIAMPTELRVEAERCSRTLAAFGKSISDATEYYVEHLKAVAKSTTWPKFFARWMQNLETDGKGKRHLSDVRSRLSRFADLAGERPIAEIATPEIDAWLRDLKVTKRKHKNLGKELSVVSRNKTRTLLVMAFNAAIKLGYCPENPAAKIAVASEPRDEDDEDLGVELTYEDVLTPREFRALLCAASPAMLPAIVLCAFCGIRRSEIERLRWRRIRYDSNDIFISKAVAKAKRERLLPIRPIVAAWLAPYKDKVKGNDHIAPANFQDELVRARKRARRSLKEAGEERHLAIWPTNALRRSFCSYFLAAPESCGLGGLNQLVKEMGHRNPDLVYNTYARAVPSDIAGEWWETFPA